VYTALTGGVGIGTTNPTTYKLKVQGSIFASADVLTSGNTSDVRMKENISELNNVLPRLRALRPVNFIWNNKMFDETKHGKEDVGLIAQEVEEVFPLVIRKLLPYENHEDLKGIAYEKLTPYIIKALQEFEQIYADKFDSMKKEIASIKKFIHMDTT
jgi:hypothetical protein